MNKRTVLIFFITVIAAGCFVFLQEIYLSHTSFHGTKSVTIPSGSGSREIAGFLMREGVIRSKWMFEIYVSLRGEASYLKPGDYTWTDDVTIIKVARDLVEGGTLEKVVTIPEGWSARMIANQLDTDGVVPADLFLQYVKTNTHDAPSGAGLEGYLFPDTYRFLKHTSPDDAAGKMLANFDAKLTPDLRTEIARQHKTIFEIIIMASLIEKEVVSDTDRAIVSGILWKRLSLGIPLQVDATIGYIKNKPGKLFSADFMIDSPYNTYRYKGLPKGPISNPGISAIRAALYPRSSPYLFYLSAPDGHTVFSRTLAEHNQAKVQFLQ